MQVASIVVTAIVALIGLYLSQSFRRQQEAKVAERRLAAYQPLWQLTKIARRSRTDPADGTGPLTPSEANELFRDLVAWYYEAGNGMFLTATTLKFYNVIRERLSWYGATDDTSGADRCMRDISLFRQQLRIELKTIAGRAYYWDSFTREDRAFLRLVGIPDPYRWGVPWYRRARSSPAKERPTSGTPEEDLPNATGT